MDGSTEVFSAYSKEESPLRGMHFICAAVRKYATMDAITGESHHVCEYYLVSFSHIKCIDFTLLMAGSGTAKEMVEASFLFELQERGHAKMNAEKQLFIRFS